MDHWWPIMYKLELFPGACRAREDIPMFSQEFGPLLIGLKKIPELMDMLLNNKFLLSTDKN